MCGKVDTRSRRRLVTEWCLLLKKERKERKKKTVPKTQFLLLGTKPKLSLLYIGKVKLFSMIAKLFVLLCCNYTVITVYTLD